MRIIYYDMDGVAVDFFGGFALQYGKKHWKEIYDQRKALADLVGTDFFFRLQEFDTTRQLIDFARDITNNRPDWDWGINSSPLRGDRDNSAYWKRRWLEKHGYMPNISNLIFTGQKENYATNSIDGSSNILVDDKPTNIMKWNDKGGIGILYQANKDSIEKLEAEILWHLEKETT